MARRGRPLGPAFVTGAVRGAIAGQFVGVPLVGLLVLLSRTIGLFLTPEDKLLALVLAVVGVPAAAAALGIGDALSIRLRGEGEKALARLLSGFAAPFLAVFPVLSAQAAFRGKLVFQHRFGASKGEIVIALVVLLFVGLCLGTGSVIAGSPVPGADAAAMKRRALAGAAAVSFMFAFPAALAFGPHVVAIALLVTYLAGLGLWAGHLVARPVGRRVVRWLEPGRSGVDYIARLERHAAAVARYEASPLAFGPLGEPPPRESLLAALAHARAAFDESLTTGSLAGERRADATRIVALLFALDQTDEIELLLREIPEADIFRAELSRRGGDPAQASSLARKALEELGEGARGSTIRGGAHAVLALAAADSGDFEAARASLAEIAEIKKREPLLARFQPAAVLAHVEKKALEARKPPSPDLSMEALAPAQDLTPVALAEEATPKLGTTIPADAPPGP